MLWVPVVAALAALAIGCGDSPSSPERKTLSVATGGKGGIYSVYGAALAKQISAHLPGYRGEAQRTTGAVDNLLRLGDGRADIAFTLGDTALDAVDGREAFDRPVKLKSLAWIYDSYVQVVTTRSSGIRSFADLKGARVSVGSPNSGTEVVADRLLEAARIDSRSGIERAQLGVDASARALKDGTIEAFFWSGGLRTSAITDLASSQALALLDTSRLATPLGQRYGGVYKASSIPAGIYPGIADEVPTIAIPNYIVVAESMDSDLAFGLTKLLFDRRLDLIKTHPEAENLDRTKAQQVIAPVALHPGAERYLRRARP